MDVSLFVRRSFYFGLALLSLSFVSCGNRYDLSTAAGQQSRIDDANSHLSRGECGAADEAISPLYNSQYVTSQVRIIKASALACYAQYNMLSFAAGLVGASNPFQAMAKSLSNVANDGARQSMYNAVDILTQNGGAMSASQRAVSENDYMIFLQFGVISAIIRNYGNPDSSGNKQTAFTYPAGTMNNVDGCALAGAFSFITDSFGNSDLSDGTSSSISSSLNTVCKNSGLGISSCSALNRDRTLCDGSNTASTNAGAIVTGVNTAW